MNDETPKKTNEDFYAVVSALARFIETADNDLAPTTNSKAANSKAAVLLPSERTE